MMYFFTMLLMLIRNMRGRGKLGAEARVNVAEHRHHFDQQEDGDQDGHDGDDGRIHHGGLDLLAQSGGVFQIDGQAGQDFRQQTAFFAGGHHAHIKPVEHFGMLLQRLGKAVAAFDPGADIADDVAHGLVGGLLGQRLERLHHRQAGVNHGGQLAREDDQIGQADASAAGPAFFADLFLDGDDEQIAIQQGGDRRLLGGRLDGTANLPAGGGFARDIDK